ncbi:hypothetical protein QVD17_24039 [Tagetes erecta]|uniref:Uncharacterized protein n=1 Tax=Tagetes erecta TaxID=13708 RepID=A0AAD8KEQ0_TARER|nr:hypothetical protein QVD17_24039 [Tagetes erecta]
MMRVRLMWFSLGFGSTAGVMANFVYKDLLLDRHSLSCQLNNQFDSLSSRLANLESVSSKALVYASIKATVVVNNCYSALRSEASMWRFL